MIIKVNNRPIDVAKKSNRRCASCAFYLGCKVGDKRACSHKEFPLAKREYWNCCKNFRWNPLGGYVSSGGGVFRGLGLDGIGWTPEDVEQYLLEYDVQTKDETGQ